MDILCRYTAEYARDQFLLTGEEAKGILVDDASWVYNEVVTFEEKVEDRVFGR